MNFARVVVEIGRSTRDLFLRRWLIGTSLVVFALVVYIASSTDRDHEVVIAGCAMVALAFGAAVQTYVEFRTWWAVHEQDDAGSLGQFLKIKMFSLGWKNGVAAMLYVLLGLALINNMRIYPFPVRMVIYGAAIVTVVAAADAGLRVVRKIEGDTRRAQFGDTDDDDTSNARDTYDDQSQRIRLSGDR